MKKYIIIFLLFILSTSLSHRGSFIKRFQKVEDEKFENGLLYSIEKQMKLSLAINATLALTNLTYPKLINDEITLMNWDKKSSINELCYNLPLEDHKQRTGCCQPLDVRHLYNVMIEKGKIILFLGDSPRTHSSQNTRKIPPVMSIRTQSKSYFNMDVEERYGKMPRDECKAYFDGTLHVLGRSTVKNVYHAITDNFVPAVSQILYDAFLAPQYLHKPRMQINAYKWGTEGALHLELLKELYSAGSKTTSNLEGMCFSRMIWGHGSHVMYYDTLLQMRRMIGDFARSFSSIIFDLKVPVVFEKSITTSSKLPLVYDDNSLKVVLFTRGTTGKGRSMQGEDKLLQSLFFAGAVSTWCCNFENTPLAEQIAFAYHADVIIGMHGAALTHAIFSKRGAITVELKTLYAYTSIVFALITDSRQGTHSQVDIRDYFIKGGHRPIDEPLINRTINAIKSSVDSQRKGNIGQIIKLSSPKVSIQTDGKLRTSGDFIMGSATVTEHLNHIMGPGKDDFFDNCKDMVFHKFRKELGVQNADSEDLHCNYCQNFVT